MAIIAGGVTAAASVFGAISSSNSSKAASDAQLEAVRLQTLVARELHEHWKSNYAACDAATIAEVCAAPAFVPQFTLWQGRARLEVLRSFARARDTVRKAQDIYNVGRAAQQCNYIAGIEAVALMDAVGFGRRFEDAQGLQLDQLRLANAYQWLGLGRNLISQSSDAAALAAAAGNRLGAAAGATTNGWLQATGWITGEQGKRLFGEVGTVFKRSTAQPVNVVSAEQGTREPGAFDESGSTGTGLPGSEPQPAQQPPLPDVIYGEEGE